MKQNIRVCVTAVLLVIVAAGALCVISDVPTVKGAEDNTFYVGVTYAAAQSQTLNY